jgi:thiosulfate reductase cytochrome b subunit
MEPKGKPMNIQPTQKKNYVPLIVGLVGVLVVTGIVINNNKK